MFFHFWQKFKNLKWPPFLGRVKFLKKLPIVHCLDTLRIQNFNKIHLSRMVKETEANLCFCILGRKYDYSKWLSFLRG